MMHYWTKLSTPLGDLYLIASTRALLKMDYGASYFEFEAVKQNTPLLKEARKQIEAYFAGRLMKFDLPVALSGTDFMKSVYRAMMKIPYGETMSYGELAALIKHPRAARAVGTSCAKSQLPLIVPCHRVVAANGIGGYGNSLWMKRWLLAHERKRASGESVRGGRR